MHILLLVLTGGLVGFLHSILPDHWVPLAVIGRTQHWSVLRVSRVSVLASAGHVTTSVVLSAIVAAIGLQFQHQIETQQDRFIGVVLALTGIGFLIWGLTSHGHSHGHTHSHDEEAHMYAHAHGLAHAHIDEVQHREQADEKNQPVAKRVGGILVAFGVAASPDLTVLPVALAASAVGVGTVLGVLASFTVATMATFVGLTVIAMLAGYQIKGEWLERHANTITAIVLIGIGIVSFVGF
jgi:nickel/cobalt transporter (NicO) family protein